MVDGGGLLVFAALIPEVERSANVLRDAGLRVGVIHGGVPADKRSDIDEQYQAGELDAVCATTDTAGTGYNWQRTTTIIIPSLGYGDDSLEQAIRRGERELREQPLRIIQLQYEDTIDQHVEKIVKKKAELTEMVMKNV
jgi:superfamily II DNA/RNA helicase